MTSLTQWLFDLFQDIKNLEKLLTLQNVLWQWCGFGLGVSEVDLVWGDGRVAETLPTETKRKSTWKEEEEEEEEVEEEVVENEYPRNVW